MALADLRSLAAYARRQKRHLTCLCSEASASARTLVSRCARPPARLGPADLWAERNSKAARRIPRELWPVVHRKLTMLDSAKRLEDLAAVPGNRFEALAGDREGQHSIRVNQQYRLTFRWETNDAYDVCCEDYH
jgi:toxin HigB-1